MKKRITKSILALLLTIIFLLSTAGVAFASPNANVVSKEEVVYVNTSATGGVQDIYVVNIFNLTSDGTIEDYGQYAEVKNLSTTAEMTNQDGKVTVEGTGERFYYQGNIQEGQLPWNIDIRYYLNGNEISADELAGSDGRVDLVISTTQNTNINSTFFNNYVLQISVTLDTDLCRNIVAPDGMFANAGKNKLITFTALPEKSAKYIVSMDAVDFEMEGIQIAAVPFSMGFDLPDTNAIASEFGALTNAVGQLSDGTSELTKGILKAEDGMAELKKGSDAFQAGLNTLSEGGKELLDGSEKILAAITAMSQGFQAGGGGDLAAFGQLPAALRGFADALDGVANNLMMLHGQFATAYPILAQNIGAIPGQTVSEDQLNALLALYPENGTLAELVANYRAVHGAVATMKGNFGANQTVFEALLNGLPTAAYTLSGTEQSIAALLRGLATNVESGLQNFDINGLIALGAGLQQLETKYGEFHGYLVAYIGGVTQIAGEYGALGGGLGSMSTGLEELYTGAGKINSGMQQLYSETKNIPKQVQDRIDEYMAPYDKSDYKPVSFVSEKNTNISSVQFVIKTEKIEKEEPEKPQEAVTETPSFWTKLKDLFQ